MTGSVDRDRRWRVALFVSAVATAVPLWCARFLPLADLPQHVAAIGVIRHFWDPALGLESRYSLNVTDSQSFLYHATGAVLSLVTGSAESANRVLLTVAALAFPYAFRLLLRALDRDPRLALFAPPAFWSAPLMMGFAPYVAAVPVATSGVALFVLQAWHPSRRRAAGLALLACVVFCLHLSAYLVFVGSVVVVAIPMIRRPLPIVASLAWLAPSLALASAWVLRGSLAKPGTEQPVTDQIAWSSAGKLIEQLPIWAHDIWRSHIDEACGVVLAGSFVALALQRGPRPRDRWLARAAWAPPLVALVAYATLPYYVGAATMLDVRMATFVSLFVPLVLAPSPGLRGSIPLTMVLVSHLVNVVEAVREVRQTEDEELGDIDRLLSEIPPRARVLTLPVHLTSTHTHWPPWAFLGSYHLARAGGEANYSFTAIRHWPIRDLPSIEPSPHPLFWTLAPCTFRNAVDGPTTDYILARAPHDIFRTQPTGPQWRRIDHEREWSLYERAEGEAWPSLRPDLGPCAQDEAAETSPPPAPQE